MTHAPGPASPPPGAGDLLVRTAELIDIPSVSHHEAPLADHVERRLRQATWLEVERIENNVVARTTLGRGLRLVWAGHLDTVPANGNLGRGSTVTRCGAWGRPT